MKHEVKYRFGDKIRLVRERRSLTLKQVANSVGLSESLISQIERNRVSPSLDTLMAIVDVLQVDLEYLFHDYKQTKKVDILRKSERKTLTVKDAVYHQLSIMKDPEAEYAIEALRIEIQPGGKKGDIEYGHPGRELGIIMEGTARLSYGTEKYDLNEGDCVSFTSDIPHEIHNTGNSILRMMWIISPPRVFTRNTLPLTK